MSSCTRISTSVRTSPPTALYFCVRLYSANPQGLHTVCWRSPPRALHFCVLQYGASPNGLCAVRTRKGVIQCAGTRLPELYPVLMCSCGSGLSEPARACASVHCTSSKSFVRCEPTKALHSVRVLAPQGFAPRTYVLVRSYEQMSLCTRTCTYVRYELTRYLCFCTGVCR